MNSSFGHIFQRTGRTGWYLRLQVDGKRHDYKAGDTKKEAQAFADDLRLEMRHVERFGAPREIEELSFENLAEKFLVHRESLFSESGCDRIRYQVRRMVKSFDVIASEVSRAEVLRYLEGRMGEIGNNSRNKELSTLRAIFRYGVDLGFVRDDPTAGIKQAKFDVTSIPHVTDEDQAVLVANVGGRVRDLVVVALNTGLRKGELLRLEWLDVHFDRGRRGVVHVRKTKTRKPRDVPMRAEVRDVLARLKADRARPIDGPDRVFSDCPKSSGAWGSRWDRIWKLGPIAIGRPELRFHDLRHLFCTNLARAGVPLADRAQLAGHSQVMALRYSDHCPENSSEAAIEAMEAIRLRRG